MAVSVKNLNGTSTRRPPAGYDSWLDYWRKTMRVPEEFIRCANLSCDNWAEVGGHVKRANPILGYSFIVPLCKACNAKSSKEVYGVDSSSLCRIR